jgi:hypothetical protein
MRKTRTAAFVAAALVAGLVAGNVISGWAVPARSGSTTSSAAAACSGLGLRLGATMRDAGGRLVDVVADLTGQDVADVQAARADGQSFEQIAAAKGVTADKVVDEALSVREELLDGKVKSGDITQEQADAALDRMQERLTDRVSSTDASCDGTGGGCGMGGGRRGMGRGAGAGCGGACGASTTVNQ